MSIIVLISLIGLLGVIIGFIIAKLFDRSSPNKQERSIEDKSKKNADNSY
jgi:uncharacterized membrane-anchored protein YhcB (DUF1043 family)